MKINYENLHKEVSLIIISHKSKKKVLKFLENISDKFKIIVIENSDDRSIRTELSMKRPKIELYFTDNKGFGSAVNYGRTFINTKYFFSFNPDIIGVSDEIIYNIYNAAKELKDKFSCIGPRYQEERNIKQSNINKKIAKISISGAAMFFNTKNFDEINGFDESFFLFFEENDYCKRGLNKKLFSYQINTAKVIHNIGTSVEYENKEEKDKLNSLLNWHFIWSKTYFKKKHYGTFFTYLYFFIVIIKLNIYKSFFKIIKKKESFNKYNDRLDAILTALSNKKSYKRI